MPINPARYKNVHQYLNQVAPISEDTWMQVADILTEKTFQPKDFFAKEGRREHQIGIVLEGIFRAFIHTEKGNDFTKTLFTPIHFKTPISYLGAYTSLVTGNVNNVNIQALSEAKVFTSTYESWLNLIKSNQEVSEWSRQLSNLFFMGKENREFQLSSMQAEQRYILFREQFPELENLISQYYIAQYIGVSPTQLSRIRKKVFQG